MNSTSIFQAHVFNSSPINLAMNNPKIVLEPGAEIKASHISDGLYMERYSGLNRSRVLGPSGIGSFSYVSDTYISPFSHIGPRTSVGGFEHPYTRMIQSSFLWGQNTFFTGNRFDESAAKSSKPETRITFLEADVWIGANCVVKAGVRLQIGSVLGAGSILTRDTTPYGIYVGNPAKLLKFRFERSIIQDLIRSEWWELPFSYLSTLDLSNPSDFLESIDSFKSNK